MIARSFKSVVWVAGVGAAALGCYMLSLQVAAERAELAKVEQRIVRARQTIRDLQTELGTRGRLSQLEQWNSEVLALSAPVAGQFVDNEVVLARLETRSNGELAEGAPVRMASAETVAPAAQPEVRTAAATAPAPERPQVRTAAATTPAPERPRVRTAAATTPASAMPTVRRASLSAAPARPTVTQARAETRPAATRAASLLDERTARELGEVSRAERGRTSRPAAARERTAASARDRAAKD
ncbi:MAG: hypothetical protein QOI38_2401 [Sphingomonadales bacterium]|jgi:hypothetical protein|nr:hypothetical protein [Sphingomonadales bacterium]